MGATRCDGAVLDRSPRFAGPRSMSRASASAGQRFDARELGTGGAAPGESALEPLTGASRRDRRPVDLDDDELPSGTQHSSTFSQALGQAAPVLDGARRHHRVERARCKWQLFGRARGNPRRRPVPGSAPPGRPGRFHANDGPARLREISREPTAAAADIQHGARCGCGQLPEQHWSNDLPCCGRADELVERGLEPTERPLIQRRDSMFDPSASSPHHQPSTC